jgi:hypothetical protein
MAGTNAYVLPPVPPAGTDAKWLQQLQSTVMWNFNATATTAKRPVNPLIGQHLFDTTIGAPIWCKSLNPVVWVNGAGTVV